MPHSNRHSKKGMQRRLQSPQSPPAIEETRDGVLAETAEQVSDYISGGVEQIRRRVRATTHDREGTVVFVALAAGFGVGIALGTLLAPRRRRSWTDRFSTEGLGQRVREGIESMVSERLAGRFRR
jgi:hypothetical protein